MSGILFIFINKNHLKYIFLIFIFLQIKTIERLDFTVYGINIFCRDIFKI